MKILNESSESVKGSALGKKFNVSRQVIVQDISLLRATGEDIIATPNGYIKLRREGVLNTIVCRHSGKYELEDELGITLTREAGEEPGFYASLASRKSGLQWYVEAIGEFN